MARPLRARKRGNRRWRARPQGFVEVSSTRVAGCCNGHYSGCGGDQSPMWKYLLLRNVFACAIFALASIVPVFGAECLPSPALQTQLQAHPNSASYESAALWFGEHKQLSCAAEAYRKAFELSPKSPRLAYMLGLNLFSDGKAASAVLPLRQSIELSPAVLKPHLVLAEALDQLGRSEEASAEWQAALKLGPTSPEALHGVAKGFLKQREYSQVIGLLR